ncbi:MAG: DUF6382 domain-containing protein [Clostridiales Family XIII bacterium]|jgi:hypothetical protein|nr:DUF6382 domain-containing protein [Clostridiales Family XIII bacterium]
MLCYAERTGGRFCVEIEAGPEIKAFEERIVASGACGALLPCTALNDGGRRLMQYDATGCVPLSEYEPESLDGMLNILHMIPLSLLEADDMLLSAEKFAISEDFVYVDVKTGGPRLIYGQPVPAGPFRRQYDDLVRALGRREHITGLPTAARQVSERVRLENPDLRRLARIVEGIRREWAYIQPAVAAHPL